MGKVSRRVRQALGGCASVAIGALVLVPSAVAAEPTGLCDEQIISPSSDWTGYRLRDDRCEGAFRLPVSAAGERQVVLISLTCGAPPAAIAANAPVVLAWSTLGPGAVALKVETLPEVSLRYRMDARPIATSFSWPNEVLKALSIEPKELSVLVLGAPKIGDIEIPGTAVLVSFYDKPDAPCADGPEARFYTRYALTDLNVCARGLETSAAAMSAPADSAMCREYPGPFTPSTSVPVSLSMLKGRSGLFELSVEARRVGGPAQPPDRFKIAVR